MPNAARLTDRVQHDQPHCHAAHGMSPVAHPPAPHQLVVNGAPSVFINHLPAATLMSQSEPCSHVGCAPNGPGVVARGSAKVLIGNQPAARAGDLVHHAGCVAPIPSPTGTILGPCSPNVLIG
jgi:uncharacterized Zn-binding protein involved in type VI secretion|nr:PAAR domain-containing protein [Kofleriaceae bacterium]